MDYVVGLGSNLGSRRAHIQAGLELIAAEASCFVRRISPTYESAPLGPPQPRYLNAAARIAGPDSPLELLERLHAIETSLGRNRAREARWGPRVLDLDILWAAQSARGPELSIPHPRLHERWFALRPLLDVAPELAPEYAPTLASLAQEPMLIWPAAALGEVTAVGRRIEIACRAIDLAEALAGSMTALGRHLQPSTRVARVAGLTIDGGCEPGHEPESFIHSALELLARGRHFTRATVSGLAAGRFAGCLLSLGGTQLPAAEMAPPGALSATSSGNSPTLRIVLRR